MTTELTWGLVIATYNRAAILPTCIKYAVEQTRKPSEIVIVDASDDWQAICDRIANEILVHHPDIRFTYVPAEIKSASCQRNQGIELATVDVLFMIDDDTFLYPDCAEKVMRVYEADPKGKIKGVQPALALSAPCGASVTDSQKAVVVSREEASNFDPIRRWVWRNIFLMDHKIMWIPYSGDYVYHELPEAVQKMNVYQTETLHGCRMTFRREIIRQEKFEPLLLAWSAAEDIDASHRVSYHGALVEVPEAEAYHFHSGTGRVPRYNATALHVLNQALYLRRNSNNLVRDRARFFRLMLRRVVAELFKDTLSRRWSLPQVRGILSGLRHAAGVFDRSLEELEQWYPALQKKVLYQESSS
jgi:glycosyltransferase involved in cell wall biosynthesis